MDTTSPAEGTSSLEAARAHARRQQGAGAATARTVPVTDAVSLPEGVTTDRLLWDETIGAGGYAGLALPRDAVIRMADLDGDACVNLQLFRAANPIERLNPADTVKVQWQAYLEREALLLSDQGRVLATVIDDTGGGHDALCGHLNRAAASERFGAGAVHSGSPNTRDLLVLAGARFELGRRDLTAGINLFRRVRVDDDGSMHLQPPAGPSHVDLRVELDLVVLVANAPHPLDDRGDYRAGTVRLTAWRADRAEPDPFRATTPERQRAFENTEDLLRGVPA